MVDDFNDISRTNAVCRLIPLVMIDQNDRWTLQIQQIALRKHSDIPSLLIQQWIVAHTLFGYRALTSSTTSSGSKVINPLRRMTWRTGTA